MECSPNMTTMTNTRLLIERESKEEEEKAKEEKGYERLVRDIKQAIQNCSLPNDLMASMLEKKLNDLIVELCPRRKTKEELIECLNLQNR